MVRNEFYIEKLLGNDAEKIQIDEEFKSDLKSKLMCGGNHENIISLPKHKNNFKQNKYFKIASGFIICVFVSGTIFKAIDSPSKNMFAKGPENAKDSQPISTAKNSTQGYSENLPSKAEQLIANSKVDTIPSIAKDSKGSATDKILGQDNGEKKGIVNKETDKDNSGEVDSSKTGNIDKGQTKVNNPTDVVASITVPTVPKIPNEPATPTEVALVPKMQNVKADVSSTLQLYDSSYSQGENSLVNVKEGAIYVTDIESSKEKKLVSYDEKTQIVEKPNFTPDNGIIYYKAEKVTKENGDIVVKNGAIYLTDKNGQESSKLVDGKNPMISKDGKNLAYETDGKIFILNLATKDKRFVDNGSQPAFSNDGNSISYVKEDKETQDYDFNTTKKDVYIKKTSSSLWIFDLATKNTYSLTNSEVNMDSDSIQSWAAAVKIGSITTNLNVVGKYTYFESIWSSNNKEIYVIRKNNDSKVFELIKFNVDK